MTLRTWKLVVLLFVIVSGCVQSEAQPGLVSDIVTPVSFTVDGLLWRHQEQISAADDEVLATFLKLRPEYVGSPNLEGVPKLFTSGRSRRFYWLHGTGDSATWSAVHFENGKFLFTEGTGDPFLR